MNIRAKSPIIILLLFFLVQLFSPALFAQENPPIRVSGFNRNRSTEPLLSFAGGAYINFNFLLTGSDQLGTGLLSSANFGTNGLVSCPVNYEVPLEYISENSLVDENNHLKYDIFFASTTSQNLSDEEAEEFKRFVNSGGILYLAGDDSPADEGLPYNKLLERLGIFDSFGEIEQVESGHNLTTDTLSATPSTHGPFGSVGALWQSIFRKINVVNMIGIVKNPDSGNFLLAEKKVGKGYLVLIGEPLHINFYVGKTPEIAKYYKNLVAMGCDKSWQDNSVVLDVPSFKQGLPPYDNVNPNWETHIYDHGNELDLWCDTNKDYASIAECGCALTSASMVMNYHGVINAPGGFFGSDPFGLNSFANGFFPSEADGVKGFFGGNFNWHYVDNFSAAAAIENNNQKVEFASRENFNVERIKQLIDEGKPVIVNVIGPWGEHWVVVKGYDPDDNRLIINDPAKEDPIFGQYSYLDELYTPKPNNSMIVYQKTNSDFRRLQFVSTSENHLLVSDSLGNKTGYDPDVGHIVDEIPNSSYVFDNYYGDPTHPDHVDPSIDGIYFLTVELPEDSEYKLQILSQDSEFHPVQIYSSDVEGGLAGKVINPDETIDDYTLTYKEETAGQEVNATEDIESIFINIDVEPFIKTNVIIPHKLFSVPVAILANDSFDVSKVIITSLTFGKTGLENSLIGCSRVMLDVNRDRKKDLICYFSGNKLDVDLQDKEIILKGIYDGEIPFDGKDKVTVIKPWFLF